MKTDSPSRNLVIIPTYNEVDNVEKIVRKIFALNPYFDVLIIDDGSVDGTFEVIEILLNEFPEKLFFINRGKKLGLGTAYITGFKWALSNAYQFIFEMDCDFSHNPEDLPRLLSALKEKADVVIGSRYVKGGGLVNWPWSRFLISRIGGIYSNLITWIGIADPTAGFVGYKSEVLEKIDLDDTYCIGYSFQVEMKFKAKKAGFKIVEIPIIFTEREFGVSKMSGKIVKEGIIGVLIIQWRYLLGKLKKKEVRR